MSLFSVRVGRLERISRSYLFVAVLLAFVILPAFSGPSGVQAESTVLTGANWLSGGGVDVMSSGSGAKNCVSVANAPAANGCAAGTVYSGDKWQCVELVNRLYLTKGWTTASWFGNGNTLVNSVPGGLVKQNNDSISYVNPGDVITLDDGGYGHGAIINTVNNNTINIVNQNTASVNSSASVASGSLSGGNAHYNMTGWAGFSVQAIIHAPGSGATPPADPDTDADGTPDSQDTCPTIPGSPLLNGCPAEFKTEGDFNGDGFGDVLAASVYPDGHGMALYVYKGSAGGLTGPEFQRELTPAAGGWDFKKSKMVATNVNGDAYSDLVIFHQGPSDEIARHVLKGSASGIEASDPNMVAIQYPYQGWKWSSIRVAGAGDFNGDTYGDVAVLAAYPNGQDAVLYSFKGSTTGLTPEFQRELVSWNGGWNLQRMKTAVTNVNGDAYADLVIFHQGLSDEIARHVLKGASTVIQPTDPNMAVLQTPAQGWKWSSLRVVGGGNFNGDSYGDVAIISAYPNGHDYALYNFFGSTTGLSPQFRLELTANTGGWDLVKTRGATSDVTGDGRTDVVLFHQGPVDEVARHILKGSAAGTEPTDPNMVGIQYPYQGWLWSRVFPL